jgi:hypothetical protein
VLLPEAAGPSIAITSLRPSFLSTIAGEVPKPRADRQRDRTISS